MSHAHNVFFVIYPPFLQANAMLTEAQIYHSIGELFVVAGGSGGRELKEIDFSGFISGFFQGSTFQ